MSADEPVLTVEMDVFEVLELGGHIGGVMKIIRKVVEDCAKIAESELSPETARRIRVKYGLPLPEKPQPYRVTTGEVKT